MGSISSCMTAVRPVCCRFVEGVSLKVATKDLIATRGIPGGVERHMRGVFTIFKQLVKVSLAQS